MARTLLAIAAFSVPCTAFVPQTSLRSHPSKAPPASDVLQQPEPAVASPPGANSAFVATAAASLAAAALGKMLAGQLARPSVAWPPLAVLVEHAQAL